MTVKQAFEKAFGPIPEGATCHIGYSTTSDAIVITPIYELGSNVFHASGEPMVNGKNYRYYAECPDISDQPATAFYKDKTGITFFGEIYDRVVEEWIESQNEKHN
jgi:hypothetical protein